MDLAGFAGIEDPQPRIHDDDAQAEHTHCVLRDGGNGGALREKGGVRERRGRSGARPIIPFKPEFIAIRCIRAYLTA